ncbi:LPXTG cell wall anchor domain-containing protein [Actinoplanes sp. NPDC051475]|uniref:LPXTG cell wall anchor domain-containing protein n=1 Tax=Actinoplanes sp. NPDC051475 TaxID=3157225 RepID=UPI00344D4AB8
MTVVRLALALTAAGTIGVPAAAVRAAPPDPAKMEAVTEIKEDEWPSKVEYKVRRGDLVRAPLGVISMDHKPVRGLVAKLDLDEDLDFAHHYRNCWYTTNAGRDIAWCEFPDVLPAFSGRAITTPVAVAGVDAEPGSRLGIGFRWQSKGWADARGGLRPVTAFFAGPGAAVVRGTSGALTVEKLALPIADIRTNGNFIRATVTSEPPVSPSPSATPSSPSASPSSPSPTVSSQAPSSAGSGAGLPVTGSGTAMLAAVGGALLAFGLVLRRTARRRAT